MSEGANVFGIDISKNTKIKHPNYKFYICDITKESDIKKFYNKIKKTKVDTLINGAALDPKISKKKSYESFTNHPISDWKKMIDVNLIGSINLTRYICKIFEKNNFNGNIINIASHYGVIAQDQKIYSSDKFLNKIYKPLEYSVSKHALIGFTKNLAAYYQSTNIRVNSLSPGGVKKNNQNNNFFKKYSNKTIVGRMADLNDYNESLIFLCKKNNRYMNGANLIVDGGASVI